MAVHQTPRAESKETRWPLEHDDVTDPSPSPSPSPSPEPRRPLYKLFPSASSTSTFNLKRTQSLQKEFVIPPSPFLVPLPRAKRTRSNISSGKWTGPGLSPAWSPRKTPSPGPSLSASSVPGTGTGTAGALDEVPGSGSKAAPVPVLKVEEVHSEGELPGEQQQQQQQMKQHQRSSCPPVLPPQIPPRTSSTDHKKKREKKEREKKEKKEKKEEKKKKKLISKSKSKSKKKEKGMSVDATDTLTRVIKWLDSKEIDDSAIPSPLPVQVTSSQFNFGFDTETDIDIDDTDVDGDGEKGKKRRHRAAAKLRDGLHRGSVIVEHQKLRHPQRYSCPHHPNHHINVSSNDYIDTTISSKQNGVFIPQRGSSLLKAAAKPANTYGQSYNANNEKSLAVELDDSVRRQQSISANHYYHHQQYQPQAGQAHGLGLSSYSSPFNVVAKNTALTSHPLTPPGKAIPNYSVTLAPSPSPARSLREYQDLVISQGSSSSSYPRSQSQSQVQQNQRPQRPFSLESRPLSQTPSQSQSHTHSHSRSHSYSNTFPNSLSRQHSASKHLSQNLVVAKPPRIRSLNTPSIITTAETEDDREEGFRFSINTTTTGATAFDMTDPSFFAGVGSATTTTAGDDLQKRVQERRDDGTPATWSDHKEKILRGPYDYLVQQPGKDIRRQFIEAFNLWLKVPEDSLQVITKVVVMLHTASLLVDDVEDSSVLRRGVPVAHNIFGTAQTINSANYVYFLALQEVQKLSNPRAIDVFTQELLNLHRGQGMDLFWRDTLTCPTEEDYLEMVGNKCGGLFRLAVKLMQAESSVDIDCVPLVNTMGLIFQICDDYLNLSSPVYISNKGLCEDLTEGKFSFPIIHSIRSNPNDQQLINILKQRTRDVEVKKYAVNYMRMTGSFEYTRSRVRELCDIAEKIIVDIETRMKEWGEADKIAGERVKAMLKKMTDGTLKDEVAQAA